MVNILGLVGIGVSGLALLFAILAMSLTYWETGNIGLETFYVGIWKLCIESVVLKRCYATETVFNSDTDIGAKLSDYLPEELGDYQEVRATVFLGIIFTASAIVPAILVMFVLQTKKVLYFVAAGLNAAAGLCLMIAMTVYAGRVAHDNPLYHFDLGACFALDIIAWLAAWVGGGLFVGAKLKNSNTVIQTKV